MALLKAPVTSLRKEVEMRRGLLRALGFGLGLGWTTASSHDRGQNQAASRGDGQALFIRGGGVFGL